MRVLVWDLWRGHFIRELRGHSSPLTAVSVSPPTGDIFCLSGHDLFMWTLNGELRARVNTSAGCPTLPTSITATGASDWNRSSSVAVVVGHRAGSISLWRATVPAIQQARDSDHPPERLELSSVINDEVRREPVSIPLNFLGASDVSSCCQQVHTSPITCLRVVSRGRELLVGDAAGLVTRWCPPRLDQLHADEALRLLV